MRHQIETDDDWLCSARLLRGTGRPRTDRNGLGYRIEVEKQGDVTMTALGRMH